MKKVLHIITGLNNGGAEAALFRLCKESTGNEHYVISLMGTGKYGIKLTTEGIKVIALDFPPGRITLRGLIKLYKNIREIKPDAIQTWMYHADLIGGLVARLAGVKNICWGIHHSNLTVGDTKASTIYIARLCSFFSCIIPRKIICCADKALNVHSELGYSKKKLVVVYNGYDLNTFYINPSSKKVIQDELHLSDGLLLGMVSRFHPFKDLQNLVVALGRLKRADFKFKLLLVGAGLTERNEILMGWLRENNVLDNIILMGARGNIPSIMNAIDLHILSSSSEAFPNVLNEAMACGTPCVTTDVGDASLIVGNTGWVVPPKNPQALANGIEQAIKEKYQSGDSWSNKRKLCRQRIVDNFSIEKMASEYNKVWFTDS